MIPSQTPRTDAACRTIWTLRGTAFIGVESDFARTLERELGEALAWQEPRLARHQPCGCIICNCESAERCSGCGAKHCGNHPLLAIPNPIYEPHPIIRERDTLRQQLADAQATIRKGAK